MSITFYDMHGSPPCATVNIVGKALGITFDVKFIDYEAKEYLNPEFIKINPQHTCPTIVDNGFVLWESRAIVTYLADKYGETDSLYPKDLQKRAVVDQRLYYDISVLNQRFFDYMWPIRKDKTTGNPEQLKKFEEALSFLNLFLDGQTYVAGGETLTLADISIAVTMGIIEAANIQLDGYPNIIKWYAMCKETMPGADLLEKNIEESKLWLAS